MITIHTESLEVINAILPHAAKKGIVIIEVQKIEKGVRPLADYKVTVFDINDKRYFAHVGIDDDTDELTAIELEEAP